MPKTGKVSPVAEVYRKIKISILLTEERDWL